MTEADFSAVQQVLADLDFPAGKQDIVRHAEQHGAAGPALHLLKALPLGTYQNISDIRSSVPLRPS